MTARILIVDDERNLRLMLEQMLSLAGHEVESVATGEEALEQLGARDYDAMLLDVRLPDMDGLETLRRIREQFPAVKVIMMSGHGTIETAVRAVHEGAVDFLEKPLSRDQVLLVLDQVLELSRLEKENRSLRAAIGEGELIGGAAVMHELRTRIAQVAPTDATVLILGESGSGKELVARAIHRQSRRADGPFLAVNCAAIPAELIESELFGHERGAFTGAVARRAGVFETAAGGTLMLDEIGDMPAAAQAKLLRVLENGEFQPVGSAKSRSADLRIVAATHRDLAERVEAGEFRGDLFHRLNVVPLEVPALRDRLEDIEVLATAFLEQAVARQGLAARRLRPDALRALGRYLWPGNVRELKNFVERLAILSPAEEISAAFVGGELSGQWDAEDTGPSLRRRVEDCERLAIVEAVRGSRGNVAEAARRLGLERAHLYKKARHLGLNLREI